MFKKIMTVLFILICLILQCSVLSALSLGGIIPNLLLILTSAYGLIRGEQEGLVIGFFCGLLLDILFSNFLGFYALIMMYIGFLNGKLNRAYYPEDYKLPIALIVISDLTYGLICYVLLFLLRGKFYFFYYLRHVILPEVVYTVVAAIFLYPLILFVEQKFHSGDKRRTKGFV
ncbi:MAG: rod shape-determining protein MreD [Acetatifactor sp.]